MLSNVWLFLIFNIINNHHFLILINYVIYLSYLQYLSIHVLVPTSAFFFAISDLQRHMSDNGLKLLLNFQHIVPLIFIAVVNLGTENKFFYNSTRYYHCQKLKFVLRNSIAWIVLCGYDSRMKPMNDMLLHILHESKNLCVSMHCSIK